MHTSGPGRRSRCDRGVEVSRCSSVGWVRHDPAVVDWASGKYERTAAELEPVSQTVVEMAALSPAVDVIDLACGTGNAALLAARRGARVVGIDASPGLLEVARERARTQGVDVDFREGDLLDLPVTDGTADVVLSVFGVIFASDPAQALGEVGRVLRPGGRVLVSAWVPAGPIDGMLVAMGRILARVSQVQPTQRNPAPHSQPPSHRGNDRVPLRRSPQPHRRRSELPPTTTPHSPGSQHSGVNRTTIKPFIRCDVDWNSHHRAGASASHRFHPAELPRRCV